MKICPKCKSEKICTSKIDNVHKVFEKDILVKEIPVYVCECGNMEYVFPRELDFQLRDAYRLGLDVITFSVEQN